MTRKHYVALAAALATTRPVEDDRAYDEDENDAHARQWEDDRDAIADVLAADNPLFDRARFIAATER